MDSANHHHSVRRILLPSGRCIEVVRFEQEPGVPTQRPLHLCQNCESDLVNAQAWTELDSGKWELSLECPNCWWQLKGVFERQQVHELEDRLDDGFAALLKDLKRLAHANMVEHIDRFVTALHADQILPEDF